MSKEPFSWTVLTDIIPMQIKELEDKMQEQEKQLSVSSTIIKESPIPLKCTPSESKQIAREEIINESEHRILRSLNQANRRGSQVVPTARETESVIEIRKKRLSRNSEIENNGLSDTRSRQSDPPKPFPRVARTTTKPVVTAQKPVARTKTSRDPVPGIKERDSKKRMWSR